MLFSKWLNNSFKSIVWLREERFNDALILVDKYVEGDPEAGFLIYRTFAGFRLIASHKTFEPGSVETQQIFERTE